jgi:hypothetical protein
MLRGGQEGIRPAAAAEDCNVVAQASRSEANRRRSQQVSDDARRKIAPLDTDVLFERPLAVTPPLRKEYDRYFQTGTDLKGLDRWFLCGRELSYSENLRELR